MWKQLSGIRGKFLPVFLTGFAAGVLYMALFGRSIVHETTLLSRYFFSKYQQVEFASGELFLYILKSRMSAFTLLWLTGFTFFGTAASLLALASGGHIPGNYDDYGRHEDGLLRYADLSGLRSPATDPVCTGYGLAPPQNFGNVGEPGAEEQPIQRRQGTAAFLSAGLVAGIFPVFPGLPARKLCKSLVFEGGFEKYLKIFYVIFTRFGGMAGKENQILWRKRKNP